MVREKIADGALIAKWRKPGYEILCSMLAIQKGNHNFGTTSHCRVPLHLRASQQRITPDVQTGCISCVSGDGRCVLCDLCVSLAAAAAAAATWLLAGVAAC